MTAKAFESWLSFWNFQREVARERRFVRSPASEQFLQSVAETCRSRVRNVPVGWPLWRAQLGHGWRHQDDIDDEVPCAFPPERMKPLPDRAFEGRANPKGIPCLYLATLEVTALSEVRPWVGSYVSVAQFSTLRPLKVIDCSVAHARIPLHFEEPKAEEKVEAVWAHIDRAFAEPVTRSDDTSEYVATQVLAELFRDRGFDGVAYKSAFGEGGFNIALFNLDDAAMSSCTLHKVDSVSCTYSQVDSTYYMRASAK